MHKYNSNDGIEYESEDESEDDGEYESEDDGEDDGIEYYMYWCDSECYRYYRWYR